MLKVNPVFIQDEAKHRRSFAGDLGCDSNIFDSFGGENLVEEEQRIIRPVRMGNPRETAHDTPVSDDLSDGIHIADVQTAEKQAFSRQIRTFL